MVRTTVVSLAFFLAFAATAVWAKPPPSPCALRLEGYGGASVLDPKGDSDDHVNANAGGAGSGACLFEPFHFQGDITGDYNDIDKLAYLVPAASSLGRFHTDFWTNLGGGGHAGLADPETGALEVTGAYNRVQIEDGPDFGVWRVGGEGDLYLGPGTLGVQGGYLSLEQPVSGKDDNGFYGRGLIRFYPTEDLKLEGIGGVASLDGDVIPHARALVEYRPDGWPVAFFTRWEGAFDNSLDQHFAVGGLRVYLFDEPATLRESDRRYFRDSCVHFLVGVRTC
jgi:hypothetical protein